MSSAVRVLAIDCILAGSPNQTLWWQPPGSLSASNRRPRPVAHEPANPPVLLLIKSLSMKKPMLLFLFAASLFAADYAAEGKLWWSHIQFLADDKLQGRDVGSEGFQKAVEYVSAQFERLGLKPGGPNGYQQPVKFERRTLIADQSSLALVRDGNEIPLALGADASLSSRADLAPSVDAPMVFVGHAFVIPEAHVDDLKGLDLRGKIAVFMSAGTVPGVPGNLMSHYQSAPERWKALKRAGAIGIATVQAPPAAGRGGNGGAGAGANPPDNPDAAAAGGAVAGGA